MGTQITLEDFKKKLSTIQDIIYFDKDHYLREKTSHSTILKDLIADGEYLLLTCVNDAEKAYFLHGTLGNLYRIYEEPETAMFYLGKCLAYARENRDTTREIVSLIRYGEALKYADKHDQALVIFNHTKVLCNKYHVNDYIDFVYQHQGKCLLEVGRVDEAQACFEEAMNIRQDKDDLSLIKSTRQALDIVHEIKAGNR